MMLTASAQLYPRSTPRRRERLMRAFRPGMIFLLAYRPGARAWAAIKSDFMVRQGLSERGRAGDIDWHDYRGCAQSHCGCHGHIGRHDECDGMGRGANLSRLSVWERILPDCANSTAFAPVSWRS